MVIELDKINNFVAVYGAENANLVRKEELIKALSSLETRVSAIKKINAEVEKAVGLIDDQTKLILTTFNSDKDQFLYTVLKQLNPNQKFPVSQLLPGDFHQKKNTNKPRKTVLEKHYRI